LSITRNQPVGREKLEIARRLRKTLTPEERALWNALRTDKLDNLHFRRQQVIAGFIVDFYCASARMALEVDGPSHLATKDYDDRRDQALCQMGIRTLRISNESVRSDLAAVLRTILKEARRPATDSHQR